MRFIYCLKFTIFHLPAQLNLDLEQGPYTEHPNLRPKPNPMKHKRPKGIMKTNPREGQDPKGKSREIEATIAAHLESSSSRSTASMNRIAL